MKIRQNIWGVVSPITNQIITIAIKAEDAIKEFLSISVEDYPQPGNWDHYYGIGFRCIQFTVQFEDET